MNWSFVKRQSVPRFVLAVLVMAFASVLAAQDVGTAEPDIPVAATSEPIEVTFGTGPFDLLAPLVGLADLPSYHATLSVSFEGMNAGQAEQWSRTYTMLVAPTRPAWQLTIENSADAAAQRVMAEIGGTRYERRNGGTCVATPVDLGDATSERWEPAGFLDSVIGADVAGTETINDVAADYYTFDERALGAAEIADAAGELWIAADGGYLVRYTLTIQGGADYFGEGVEGILTWDYALSDVNEPVEIMIPADCPPPLLDVPIMTDAADVLHLPGFTRFSTPSTLEDVVVFYEEQVAASGWQPANPPMILQDSVLYGFTKGDQSLLLIASNEGTDTSIQIQQVTDPAALAITAEMPEIVIAPEDTLGDCATGGVPILGDAFDVISLTGGLNYMTSTSLTDTTAFYVEQLAALGAEVSPPMNVSNMTMFEATRGYHTIQVVLLPEGQNVRVSLVSNTGSPVTPVTQCAVGGGACEPGGIPIIPGATSLQTMAGMIMYTTTVSVADAVSYYEEQIEAAGGQVSSMAPATDMMAMLDVRVGNLSLMLMIGSSGQQNSVSITSLTGAALPEPTVCGPAAHDAPQATATITPSEPSDAECMISTASNANQRRGPGTSFDLAGTLVGGVPVAADGQATGADGFVWWRLGEGIWVRSDVVEEAGDCVSLPLVQP